MICDDEKKALLWLRDKNPIQRNVHGERSGKKSVVEHDLSGGQAALIRILLSKDELSEELRAALAFALQPIGNSLLQLKKRSRFRPGRPSKLGEVRDSFEVQVVPKEVEYEKSKLLWERPRQAAGMRPKPIKTGDAIKNVGEKIKIRRAKVYKLIKRSRAISDKSLEHNNK